MALISGETFNRFCFLILFHIVPCPFYSILIYVCLAFLSEEKCSSSFNKASSRLGSFLLSRHQISISNLVLPQRVSSFLVCFFFFSFSFFSSFQSWLCWPRLNIWNQNICKLHCGVNKFAMFNSANLVTQQTRTKIRVVNPQLLSRFFPRQPLPGRKRDLLWPSLVSWYPGDAGGRPVDDP